jgi:hypothetical protein
VGLYPVLATEQEDGHDQQDPERHGPRTEQDNTRVLPQQRRHPDSEHDQQ